MPIREDQRPALPIREDQHLDLGQKAEPTPFFKAVLGMSGKRQMPKISGRRDVVLGLVRLQGRRQEDGAAPHGLRGLRGN